MIHTKDFLYKAGYYKKGIVPYVTKKHAKLILRTCKNPTMKLGLCAACQYYHDKEFDDDLVKSYQCVRLIDFRLGGSYGRRDLTLDLVLNGPYELINRAEETILKSVCKNKLTLFRNLLHANLGHSDCAVEKSGCLLKEEVRFINRWIHCGFLPYQEAVKAYNALSNMLGVLSEVMFKREEVPVVFEIPNQECFLIYRRV